MTTQIKTRNRLLTIIQALIFLLLLAGVFELGLLLSKPPEVIKVEKNVIEVEMDKSCFTQFENNIDKTIYVKLNFK